MSRPVPRTPWPGRSRPVLRPLSGNGVVPVSADRNSPVGQALACAERGWPVFPCKPGTKQPATRHGFHDATTDPDQIRSWWAHWPEANLAVATGAPGPDVLDVDRHGDAGNGYPALLVLKRAALLENAGAVVRTPRDGLHIYFAGSGQASGRLPRHYLDFKAAGGYVLVPPSRIDGGPYYVIRQTGLAGGLRWAAVTETLEPPVVRAQRQAIAVNGGDVGRLASWLERLEEGNRNAGLFWAACRAVESGQARALDEIAAAAAATGLSHQEIARTIDSAKRRGGRQPGREATP